MAYTEEAVDDCIERLIALLTDPPKESAGPLPTFPDRLVPYIAPRVARAAQWEATRRLFATYNEWLKANAEREDATLHGLGWADVYALCQALGESIQLELARLSGGARREAILRDLLRDDLPPRLSDTDLAVAEALNAEVRPAAPPQKRPGRASRRSIAEVVGLDPGAVARSLAKLREAGIAESVRGANGGWRLAARDDGSRTIPDRA